MLIKLNGEDREVNSELSLTQLVDLLELKPEQIAVEVNKEVVRRTNWPTTLLKEGDQLEVVHFVGGGSAATGSADFQITVERGCTKTPEVTSKPTA